MKNEKSDSIAISRRYLDSLVIEGRIVGSQHPSTQVTVLGKTFETPIVPGALSHLKAGMAGYAEGARLAGYPDVIKVIKPYAVKEEVYARIRAAERLGAFGVGMDVEHMLRKPCEKSFGPSMEACSGSSFCSILL